MTTSTGIEHAPQLIDLAGGHVVRVLIVEDSEDQRILMERALAGPTIDVLSVGSGEEAARLLDHVDLVLIDHGLPGMTGLDLLQQLNQTPQGPSAILVTASDSTTTVVEALRHGAVDYVTKQQGFLATLPDVVMRAHRQHDLARRTRELQRLALLVHRAGDAEGVADEIVSGAQRLLHASECILLTDRAGRWRVEARIGDSAHSTVLLSRIPDDVPEPGHVEVVHHRHIMVSLARGFSGERGVLLLLDVKAPVQEELDLAQTFAAFAATALDNVRRHETEQALIEELQSTVDARRNFVASISHELRTPLTSITGFTEILMTRWDELDDQLRSDCLARIRGNGAELVRLIEQLIDIAGLERGQGFVAIPVDLPLAKAVHECTDNLGSAIDGRRIHVLGDDVVAHVDPSLFRRAVANLVTNAVKYSAPDRPVVIRLRQAHGRAIVSVVDRGIGMAERDLDHIFEPFWRSSQAVTDAIRGSGIGLALVQQYVKAMGGTIAVETQLGSGSTFSLHLPAASTDRADQEA